MDEKETKFIGHLDSKGCISFIYVKIEDSDSFSKIYDLFMLNHHFEPSTSEELLYYGVYYRAFNVNVELMEKYYIIAIEKGNYYAMSNLARSKQFKCDHEAYEKYMSMAADHGYVNAMKEMGAHYKREEQTYDLCVKYLMMAIQKGDTDSMESLASFYRHLQPNYKLMKKYYLMAYDTNYMTHIHALKKLISYYIHHNQRLRVFKCYMMAASNFEDKISELKKDESFINELIGENVSLKSQKSKLKRTILDQQLQINHLKFKPGKSGFQEAKTHFEELALSS